jgi:glutamate/aspartate transport system substrate-binding protein
MFRIIGAAVAAAMLAATVGTPALAQEDSFVLKRIKERGEINVGHREASIPFSYIGPDGKPIGYTIDQCMKIVDKIKEEIQAPNLKVKFVPVTSQTRIALMANGTIDIECGSTTNNLTRQKQVDYLAVTFITGTQLASKKGSGIKEIEDLNGKAIALSLGTTNEPPFTSTRRCCALRPRCSPGCPVRCAPTRDLRMRQAMPCCARPRSSAASTAGSRAMPAIV